MKKGRLQLANEEIEVNPNNIIPNQSGYFRVYKRKSSRYKQGFYFEYLYTTDGVNHRIRRRTISELKKAVYKQGLAWIKYKDLINGVV